MFKRRLNLALLRVTALATGTLWITACGVSDIQLRDFVVSTSSRVFWQTLGTALQATLVGSAAT